MSSTFLVRQICRNVKAQRFRPTSLSSGQRSIHLTGPVYKKKSTAAVEELFSEDAFPVEEDLFKDPTSPSSAKPTSVGTSGAEVSNSPKGRKSRRRSQLSPNSKLKRLDALLEFIEPRIGKKPMQQTPLVRKSSWLTALDLVANEEQMKRVVDIFPKLKEGKGEFPEAFAEAFTRRCDELKCTNVALSTFGNFAKYRLELTLPAGRWLLHSLRSQPTSQTLLAASLYDVYNLIPITQDLTSAALLAATCYDSKHRTDDTVKIATALMPHLQRMLKEQSSLLAKAKTPEELRRKKLATMALRRINFFAKPKEGQGPLPVELLPRRVEMGNSGKQEPSKVDG